ncbi:MAG: hypothetical protein JW894_12760 [Bacteroidales bacterium]|nr:hypothetical protein [Bacteroidales bacterium]
MRTIKQLYYLLLLTALILVSSCKDDEMTPWDTMIAFEIEDVPVTEDYLVGAVYYNVNDWSAFNYEEPQMGTYGAGQPVSDTAAMQQHVEWGAEYGLDFFLFDFSPGYNEDIEVVHTDSGTYADIFTGLPNAGSMNFALKFHLGYMGLNVNNRMYVNDSIFDMFVEGFKFMIPYFENENYQMVDGRYLVYLSGAADLYSDSTLGNSPVYDELRAQLLDEGIEVYIVGEQGRWTPPARYELRMRDCVDAVTHREMILTTEYEGSIYFHQWVYLNWEYSSEYFAGWGTEFVPQISPAFTDRVENPSSGAYEFDGGDEDFFRDFCDVAKANCHNSGRLIIIDSFNNWVKNTQIEPSVGFGTMCLEVVNNEFKVN